MRAPTATWFIGGKLGIVAGMTQLLSISEVAKRLSISRRAAFTLVKTPGFPAAVRLSSRMVRYREADLDSWIATRVSQGSEARKSAACGAAV